MGTDAWKSKTVLVVSHRTGSISNGRRSRESRETVRWRYTIARMFYEFSSSGSSIAGYIERCSSDERMGTKSLRIARKCVSSVISDSAPTTQWLMHESRGLSRYGSSEASF
jgi:hypothetical protein